VAMLKGFELKSECGFSGEKGFGRKRQKRFVVSLFHGLSLISDCGAPLADRFPTHFFVFDKMHLFLHKNFFLSFSAFKWTEGSEQIHGGHLFFSFVFFEKKKKKKNNIILWNSDSDLHDKLTV
jgi:hypothetical protein